MKIIHASTIGRAHVQEKTKCQDATFSINQKGFSGISLADGAGSKKLSHLGAKLVTKMVLRYTAKNFSAILEMGEAIAAHHLIQYLQSELKSKYGEDIREYASTLLFAITRNSDGRTIVGHIGDGHILAKKDDGLSVMSLPENGAYQNSTYFVTESHAKDHLRISFLSEPVSGFMLMSDGSSHSLVSSASQSPSVAAKKFFDWLEGNETKIALKAVEGALKDVISAKTHDDCSLAIMVQ